MLSYSLKNSRAIKIGITHNMYDSKLYQWLSFLKDATIFSLTWAIKQDIGWRYSKLKDSKLLCNKVHNGACRQVFSYITPVFLGEQSTHICFRKRATLLFTINYPSTMMIREWIKKRQCVNKAKSGNNCVLWIIN